MPVARGTTREFTPEGILRPDNDQEEHVEENNSKVQIFKGLPSQFTDTKIDNDLVGPKLRRRIRKMIGPFSKYSGTHPSLSGWGDVPTPLLSLQLPPLSKPIVPFHPDPPPPTANSRSVIQPLELG